MPLLKKKNQIAFKHLDEEAVRAKHAFSRAFITITSRFLRKIRDLFLLF